LHCWTIREGEKHWRIFSQTWIFRGFSLYIINLIEEQRSSDGRGRGAQLPYLHVKGSCIQRTGAWRGQNSPELRILLVTYIIANMVSSLSFHVNVRSKHLCFRSKVARTRNRDYYIHGRGPGINIFVLSIQADYQGVRLCWVGGKEGQRGRVSHR
jgi:hypothetical protein